MINLRTPVLLETAADRWRGAYRKNLGMLPVAYIEVLEGEAWVEHPHGAK